MKVDLYDNKGKKKSTKADLDDAVFGIEVNNVILAQSVFVYMANQRQGNAHTKDRSEVRGGGKKPWRQKGTGRARAGSNRSPIWTGGGVTFGPRNERNFKKSLNKKVRRRALRSAFSKLAGENKVIVMERIAPKKTKEVRDIVNKLKIDGKITFFQTEEEGLYKSAKNIKNVDVKRIGEVSAYDILNAGTLILFKEDLELISKLWGKDADKSKSAEVKSEVKSKKTKKK